MSYILTLVDAEAKYGIAAYVQRAGRGFPLCPVCAVLPFPNLGEHLMGAHHPIMNGDLCRACASTGGITVQAGRCIVFQRSVEIHSLFLITVVFEVHTMSEHIINWHIAGATA